MIPEMYLTEYQQVRARSRALAECGRLAEGYTALLEQWENAAALQEQCLQWAFPLTILYLAAMDEYCELFWVRQAQAVAVGPATTDSKVDPAQSPQMRRAVRKGRQDVAQWRAWLRSRRPKTR